MQEIDNQKDKSKTLQNKMDKLRSENLGFKSRSGY